MAVLTISIPDRLFEDAQARLSARGGAGVEAFLLSSLQALAQDGEAIDSELEAQLLEGVWNRRMSR